MIKIAKSAGNRLVEKIVKRGVVSEFGDFLEQAMWHRNLLRVSGTRTKKNREGLRH